jgi:hypothetical protein
VVAHARAIGFIFHTNVSTHMEMDSMHLSPHSLERQGSRPYDAPQSDIWYIICAHACLYSLPYFSVASVDWPVATTPTPTHPMSLFPFM